MRHLKTITIIVLIICAQHALAQNVKRVSDFNKAIISPHIETTFVQGDENSVTILDNSKTDDIVNIEVSGKTLRVYLDDAKVTTKNKKVKRDGYKRTEPIYKGKVLTIIVTYKYLDNLSLRGEQHTVCESLIEVDEFKLKIYGQSQVMFNEVDLNVLNADIYGESQLTVKKGKIGHQWITAFGESDINLAEVTTQTAKLKAFGEAIFRVQSSEQIKFTAFGEAKLFYKGNPEIDRGLSIGDSSVTQIN